MQWFWGLYVVLRLRNPVSARRCFLFFANQLHPYRSKRLIPAICTVGRLAVGHGALHSPKKKTTAAAGQRVLHGTVTGVISGIITDSKCEKETQIDFRSVIGPGLGVPLNIPPPS